MLFILLFLAVTLTGCKNAKEEELIKSLELANEQIYELQKINQTLLEFIKRDENNINASERSAGIAVGCNWLVNFCPKSVTENGVRALSEGYTPNILYFWGTATLKLIALSIVCSVFVFLLSITYLKVIRPGKFDIENAKLLILEADERVSLINANLAKEIEIKQSVITKLIKDVEEQYESLAKISLQNDLKIKQQDNLKSEIERLLHMRDLLNI